MTGYNIFESAMLKLGYGSIKGTSELEEPFKKAAVDAINEISADICGMKPIKTLFDEVALNEKAASVVSYGVAAILSLYNHDTEKNTVMTAIFNARRTAYLSEKRTVKDVFPDICEV